MKFNLDKLADRLKAVAGRASDITVEVTATDLVLVKGGHGTGRSESLPFAALFLQPADMLGQAMDRLEKSSAG